MYAERNFKLRDVKTAGFWLFQIDLFADDDDFRGNFVNVNDFEEEDDDVMVGYFSRSSIE